MPTITFRNPSYNPHSTAGSASASPAYAHSPQIGPHPPPPSAPPGSSSHLPHPHQTHNGPSSSYPSPPSPAPVHQPTASEIALSLRLNSELPTPASADLVPLSVVLDAVIRDIYAKLNELGEVLPSLHEGARAGQMFQFAAFARRQVVKLLALVRWCREGEIVEKCMNVIAFLQRQNAQFDEAIDELTAVRTGLAGTRLRNPDILTALDILTTGTYERLPQRFQDDFKPVAALTHRTILDALVELNRLISYRLRVQEIIPTKMREYHIADGRAYFTVSNLFRASFSLTGAQKAIEEVSKEERAAKVEQGKDGGTWYLVDLEFLFSVGGKEEAEDIERDFPRKPPTQTFDEIAYVSNMQLTPPPSTPKPEPILPSTTLSNAGQPQQASTHGDSPRSDTPKFKLTIEGVEALEKEAQNAAEKEAKEKEVVVHDAPLVRVFNLLQSLSLTYQLEILFRQTQRIKNLGWSDCFLLEMSKERNRFKISYWPRQRLAPRPPPAAGAPSSSSSSSNLPPIVVSSSAGYLTISLVSLPTEDPSSASSSSSNLTPSSTSTTLAPASSSTSTTQPSLRQSTLDSLLSEIEEAVKLGSGSRSGAASVREAEENVMAVVASGSGRNVSMDVDSQEASEEQVGRKEQKKRVSDKVVEMGLKVEWEVERRWAGGIDVGSEIVKEREELIVEASNLDIESILLKVVRTHSNALVRTLHQRVISHPVAASLFDIPGGDISLRETDDGTSTLLVRLRGDDYVTVSVDPRSGRIVFQDGADVIFQRLADGIKAVNDNPALLAEVLVRLKVLTAGDLLEHNLLYLGLKVVKRLPWKQGEMAKFPTGGRAYFFVPIQSPSPSHLAIIMFPSEWRYALIRSRSVVENGYRWLVLAEELGWIDTETLLASAPGREKQGKGGGVLGKRGWDRERKEENVGDHGSRSRSMPSLDDLRLIHAYCAARVTTLEIENQLRSRQIPYHLVTPQPSPPLDLTFSTNLFPTELPVNLSSLALPAVLQTQQPTSSSSASSNQNSLAAAIPIISVQTSDLFRALPAAVDIALPHVSMRVANWWKAGDKCQVITSVKLRHKPTLAGEQSSSTSTSSPSASSKHVIVDPLSSVVSFISEDINECVDSLTEEFGRVGKLAVIASEINRLKDPNLRMTSFNLQTATFIYSPGLLVSIGWQSSPLPAPLPGSRPQANAALGGTYDVSFDVSTPISSSSSTSTLHRTTNPHQPLAAQFRDRLNESDGPEGVLAFIRLLRLTLPLLEEAHALLSSFQPSPPSSTSPSSNPSSTSTLTPTSFKIWPRSVSTFCFIYENAQTRYGLAYTLVPNSPTPRYLVTDASLSPSLSLTSTISSSRPRFHPIPNLQAIFSNALASSAATAIAPPKRSPSHPPPVVILGSGQGLMCDDSTLTVAMRVLHGAICSPSAGGEAEPAGLVVKEEGQGGAIGSSASAETT